MSLYTNGKEATSYTVSDYIGTMVFMEPHGSALNSHTVKTLSSLKHRSQGQR